MTIDRRKFLAESLRYAGVAAVLASGRAAAAARLIDADNSNGRRLAAKATPATASGNFTVPAGKALLIDTPAQLGDVVLSGGSIVIKTAGTVRIRSLTKR